MDTPADTIHATCVAIGGDGVLLLGPSGSGKSDLALRLIDRGAVLVADDRCIIERRDDDLLCRAPAGIAGKLEVRGIGIVARPRYGPAPVRLAVQLADSYDRMPDRQIATVAGVTVPAVRLTAFEASAPIKVELALTAVRGAA
jgi:serine kinase of HPr protein (carbohydrate metabolism regulator)